MLQKRTLFQFALLVFLLHIGLHSVAQETTNTISDKEKVAFIKEASKLMNENYVFPEIAVQIEKHLNKKLEEGAFNKITDLNEFAQCMTKEIQSISKDKHMRVRIKPKQQISKDKKQNPIEMSYLMKEEDLAENYGMTRIEKLENNIGVLEISSFSFMNETAIPYIDAAMKLLSSSDALIIDCRRNGGGNPDMVKYVCSYFFEKPTHINSLYSRRTGNTTDFITLEKVNGIKMIDIPIFVLTSSYTFSGAEEFAYNLQTQKRAVIIGETTGGGANPGRIFLVSENLGLFIPTGKAINPITKTNWEGIGVKPDIEIEAANTFETALSKAKEAGKIYRQRKTEKALKFINDLDSILTNAEKLFVENKSSEANNKIKYLLNEGIKMNILDEQSINQIGYDYLPKNKDIALAVFKFNADFFSNSANAYDSLGEMYMLIGNKEFAIENYEKALKLNPEMPSAIEALKKLKGK